MAVLIFLSDYRSYLYLGALTGILWGGWQLWRAQQRWLRAAFGLERAAAQTDRSQAATVLFGCLAVIVLTFILTNPLIQTVLNVPLPTPNLSATELSIAAAWTATPTPPIEMPGLGTPTPDISPTPLPSATPLFGPSVGCENPLANINSPLPGAILAGEVIVQGNASILNFAFYTIDISTLGDNWLPVVTGSQASPADGGVLGTWDASFQEVGNHALRLTVYDTQGNHAEPCMIPITIAR
jgi:hypothetical protein